MHSMLSTYSKGENNLSYGNNTAFISDYEYFENREIKNSVPQPWLLHEKYNSVTQSENLKKLNEEEKPNPFGNQKRQYCF